MGLDKMRIILYHPAKLQDRQVITAILGMEQSLVIFFYIDTFCLQTSRLILDLMKIMDCPALLWLQVAADDPLHQGLCCLSHLIVDQTQQISGICLVFIKMKTFL